MNRQPPFRTQRRAVGILVPHAPAAAVFPSRAGSPSRHTPAVPVFSTRQAVPPRLPSAAAAPCRPAPTAVAQAQASPARRVAALSLQASAVPPRLGRAAAAQAQASPARRVAALSLQASAVPPRLGRTASPVQAQALSARRAAALSPQASAVPPRLGRAAAPARIQAPPARRANAQSLRILPRLLPGCLLPGSLRSAAALLLGLLLCGLLRPAAQAQTFARTLNQVQVYGQRGERVEFLFNTPYQGKPSLRLAEGMLSVSFSASGAQPPSQTLRPPQGALYEQIKIRQGRYGVTVWFQLGADIRLDPARVRFEPLDSRLVMHLDAALQPPPAAGGAAAGAAAAQGVAAPALAEFSLWRQAGVMLLAMAGILGGLYAVLWLHRRLTRARSSGGRGIAMRILGAFPLGPKQRVVVLELDGERIACGVTPQQITFLTRLSPPRRAPAREAGQEAAAQGQALPAPPPQPVSPPAEDPVRQFASTLRRKVQGLKDLR